MHSIKTIIIAIAMSVTCYIYGGYVTDRYTVQVCMCIYIYIYSNTCVYIVCVVYVCVSIVAR